MLLEDEPQEAKNTESTMDDKTADFTIENFIISYFCKNNNIDRLIQFLCQRQYLYN